MNAYAFNDFAFHMGERSVSDRAVAHLHPRSKRADALAKLRNIAGHVSVARYNKQREAEKALNDKANAAIAQRKNRA